LLYLRQSAPGIGEANAAFSVPEIQDIGSGLKSIKELGTFSEIDFTVVGLGTPREIPAGVVDGRYFEVMGLHPVLGRLLTPADDGQNAAGAVVLTYHFWRTSLHSDPSVIGKARVPRLWLVFWNHPFPIRWQRRSSPISSPARIISLPQW
jgi:hypothetical protein